MEIFYDKNICDFYFSNKKNSDLFMKTKNILDSATQSASSIMLENLYKNSFFFSDRNYAIILIEDIIKNNWARVRSGPISYIGFLKAAHLVISEPNFIVLFKKDGFYKEIKEIAY